MSKCGDDIHTCRCNCYGCKFHCAAHWPLWQRALLGWSAVSLAKYPRPIRWLVWKVGRVIRRST